MYQLFHSQLFSAPTVNWTQEMFPAPIIHSSASPSTDQTWSSDRRRGSTPHSTVLSARTFRCHLRWASWRSRPPPQLPPAPSHGLAVQGETSKSGYNIVWLFNRRRASPVTKRLSSSEITVWTNWTFEHSLWPWPSTQQSSIVTEHFGLRWSIVTLHLVAKESLVQ